MQLVVNNARFLILPWVQVKNLASWVLAAQLPPVAGGLAQPLRLPPPAAGDLRPVRSVRRHQLPCRQLGPRRANPRPRQTRCPQPTRSAQEGHLALSAPPGFPPPPLRPARSSLQPVDRIFTFIMPQLYHWLRDSRLSQVLDRVPAAPTGRTMAPLTARGRSTLARTHHGKVPRRTRGQQRRQKSVSTPAPVFPTFFQRRPLTALGHADTLVAPACYLTIPMRTGCTH